MTNNHQVILCSSLRTITMTRNNRQEHYVNCWPETTCTSQLINNNVRGAFKKFVDWHRRPLVCAELYQETQQCSKYWSWWGESL